MDQAHVIRHKVRVEKLSVRQVREDLGISRNTVRWYLRDETPIGERRASARPTPVRDAVADRAHALMADSGGWTAGKQRLTATRLHQMLRGEGLDVGATLIKELVHEWRRQRQEVFVPPTYRPGEFAEVDFFEVVVEVGGERRKAHLFVMRLMFSGCDFGWLYDRQDQVCFLDGLVRAFHHFGFVPRRIAFDNLKPAVRRLLRGSMRELAKRFAALVTHHLFEPCFARPRTGHDKAASRLAARASAIRSWCRSPSVRFDARAPFLRRCEMSTSTVRRCATSTWHSEVSHEAQRRHRGPGPRPGQAPQDAEPRAILRNARSPSSRSANGRRSSATTRR